MDGEGRQSDAAYHAMREMVRRREFAPGQILSENQLAKMLGYGRTPVREAVLRLGYEGLFELLPKRGILVQSLDAREVAELYEVRSRLETLAAARAAAPGRISAEGVAELQAIIDRQIVAERAAPSVSADLRAVDREFHTTIWAHAGNRRLQTMLLALLDAAELDPLWDQIMLVQAQRPDAHTEHQEILDAIAANDARRAEDAMLEHGRSYQRGLFEHLTHDSLVPR